MTIIDGIKEWLEQLSMMTAQELADKLHQSVQTIQNFLPL